MCGGGYAVVGAVGVERAEVVCVAGVESAGVSHCSVDSVARFLFRVVVRSSCVLVKRAEGVAVADARYRHQLLL